MKNFSLTALEQCLALVEAKNLLKCSTNKGKGHGLISSIQEKNINTHHYLEFLDNIYILNAFRCYKHDWILVWAYGFKVRFAPITPFGFGPLLQVEGCMPI